MVAEKYKLINLENNNGVWISREVYLKLIKICKIRNDFLYKKLISDYEFLENKKFDESKFREI